MTNSLQKIENRSRLFGSVGSAAVCFLLFLLLFFTYLPEIKQYTEEGIMVSFGDSFDGGGTGGDYGGSAGGNFDDGGYATQQTAERLIAQTVTKPFTSPNDAFATQDDNSGVYAAQQAATEAARQKAIRDEEAARIAEQQRVQQAAIDRASRFGSALAGSEQSAKGSGTGYGAGTGAGNASGNGAGNGTGAGSGVGSGDGNGRRGNPAGRGNDNGSWDLKGRELLGALAIPAYNSNDEGTVVVNISVNESGKVTDVTILRSTTSDRNLLNAAVAAAKKAKFSSGTGIVNGTITYNFRLN